MPKKKIEEDKKEEVSVDTDLMMKNLTAYLDTELDKRLEKVVNDKLKKEVFDEVEKANKKIIRSKNRKIFVKNIFLILFFLIIVFLVYLLYTSHYFDRFFTISGPKKSEVVEKVEEKQEEVIEPEVVEPTLDELIDEYGSYLDPYVLSEKSIYLSDFYKGNLSSEVKNYFTLNTLDFSDLDVEDDYNVIESNIIGENCSKLFSSECSPVNFDYNGNKVRYFEKLDSYISNSVLEKNDTLIEREIIGIDVNKNKVTITTVEGVVVDNQLYSIDPNHFVGEYYGEGLSNYQEDLNTVIYTFKNQKLVSVEKG